MVMCTGETGAGGGDAGCGTGQVAAAGGADAAGGGGTDQGEAACGAFWGIGGSVGNIPDALGEPGVGGAITGCSTDVNSGGFNPRRSAVSASSTRAEASSI